MWFYIQNIATGMVLDVKNNGKNVELITYPYHGGNNQLFRQDPMTQMIYSKLNGLVLDINASNNKVILYPAHGGPNQRWTFDGDSTIRSHLGKVLDVATKENKLTGTWSGQIIVYPRHGGPNQKFRRVYV